MRSLFETDSLLHSGYFSCLGSLHDYIIANRFLVKSHKWDQETRVNFLRYSPYQRVQLLTCCKILVNTLENFSKASSLRSSQVYLGLYLTCEVDLFRDF